MSDASPAKPSFKPLPKPKRQRLRVFRVEGLFGKYDHTIPLRWDERVTVLHGPNGVGKTAVLRLIDAVGRGKVEEIVDEIPFRRIEVELEDGTRIEWRKATEEEKKSIYSSKGRRWVVHAQGEQAEVWDAENQEHADRLDSWSTPMDIEAMSTAAGRRWFRGKVHEDFFPALLRYRAANQRVKDPGFSPLFIRVNRLNVPCIGWEWFQRSPSLETFRASTPPTFDENGQEEDEKDFTTPEAYSFRVADLMEQTVNEYGALAQQLDRTLPARLVRRTGAFPLDTLRERLADFDTRRAALEALALLAPIGEDERPALDAVTEQTAPFLSLYVEDIDAKLAVLERFAAKSRRLRDSLNARLLNKSVEFARDVGIVVLDHDGSTLPLDKLSSGEEHQLVLLVDLLFHTAPGSLLLIDEPELSMHVVWQQQVLPDLLEIAKLSDFDVIVATHSPDIIGSYNHLEVALSGKVTA